MSSFNSLASAFGSQLLWSRSIQLVQCIRGGPGGTGGVQDVDGGGHANVYSKVMSTLERCSQWQREQELFEDWVTRGHLNVKLRRCKGSHFDLRLHNGGKVAVKILRCNFSRSSFCLLLLIPPSLRAAQVPVGT